MMRPSSGESRRAGQAPTGRRAGRDVRELLREAGTHEEVVAQLRRMWRTLIVRSREEPALLAGRWASRRALVGRYLDRDDPTKGRFTRGQVDRILARTWETYDRLAPGARVERLQTHGARQNALLAVFALAVYRALLAEGVNAKYATDLVTDLAWTVYQKWVVVPRLIARVATNDPQAQMNVMLRMFLRFPFSRPGYDWKAWTDESGAYAIDFYRCPMRDYLRSQGEEEFMLNSLCTLDFALAQVMAKGGRYERPHTLSAGDGVCDMKWRAESLPASAATS